MKKIEWHLQILQWIHTLVVTFMALITAGFMLTMLENFQQVQRFILVKGQLTALRKLALLSWSQNNLP